jgi:allantoin racemase
VRQAFAAAAALKGTAVRILLINPNISESVSDLIRAEAQRSAAPGTEINVLTAAFGVAYIETRFEALVGAYAAAELAAEHAASHDAVVIAAFGDPGLAGIRELLPMPVVGMTDSALASACLLGHRFSIIAISQRIQAWYREVVQANGLASRLASIRALDQPLADIGAVQQDHATRLQELCERAVDEDGADVIILAGAPLAGLARGLRGRLPVPVVDGVSSAVCHAQTLVSLQPGSARRGSFMPPPVKPNKGLSASLARALAAAHTP